MNEDLEGPWHLVKQTATNYWSKQTFLIMVGPPASRASAWWAGWALLEQELKKETSQLSWDHFRRDCPPGILFYLAHIPTGYTHYISLTPFSTRHQHPSH